MSVIYANFLYHMEEMIHKQYEISSTIKHKGEKGRLREDGLAQFLKDNLPDKYGIGTGEIISSGKDDPSPQCDIIIYDRLNMPIIGKSNIVQQIPIEAVFAVIEVKSSLDSASLNDAKHKFASIRKLPKCEPETPLGLGKVRGPRFYLFGYKLKVSTNACSSFVEKNTINSDTAVYALDTGGTLFLDKEVSDVPESRAIFIQTTSQREEKPNVHFTLGLFFVDVLSSLEDTDLGKVNFAEMLAPLAYNVDEVLNLKRNT